MRRVVRVLAGLAAAACIVSVLAAAETGPTNMDLSVFDPISDPTAIRDVFRKMSEAQLREWSYDLEEPVMHKLSQLKTLTNSVYVDVKLVGFEGDGNMGVKFDARSFANFFSVLGVPAPINVAEEGKTGHRINVRTKTVINVIHAKRLLHSRIFEIVRSNVLDKGNSELPFELIDNVIREDYRATSLGTYTIYLLNTKAPTDSSGECVRYVHQQVPIEDPEVKKAQSTADSTHDWSVTGTTCGTQMWLGQGRDRYMWIDLTSGPVTYGPHIVGEGIVDQWSVPRVDYFFGPTNQAAQYGSESDAYASFMTELVALVRRTCQQLLTPPLTRPPRKMEDRLQINFHVVSEHYVNNDVLDPANLVAAQEILDLEYFNQQLRSIKFPMRDVAVYTAWHHFGNCPECVLAYQQALKGHTSTIMVGDLKTEVHRYLDSSELVYWLEKLRYQISRGSIATSTANVLNVFLFDLSTKEIVLLDRFHQAVAGSPDTVVAVRTRAGRVILDYVCDDTPVAIDTRDPHRAIMAAVLDAAWGIAAPHRVWSVAHQEMRNDFLWAVGHNPFSPFTSSNMLSFSQNDMALRNVLLGMANNSMSEMADLLDHFANYEIGIDEIMDYDDHLKFVRRWNLYEFKLNRADTLMSLHNYDHAYYFLRSADHDVRAMHRLVHDAGSRLTSYLTCDKPPEIRPLQKFAVLMCLITVFTGMYMLPRWLWHDPYSIKPKRRRPR